MKSKSTIDGSPSFIQIAPGTNPKQIDGFLNEFNRTIEELDLRAFCELQDNYPFVSEAGSDPFFDEIKEKIETNLAEGNSCLAKSDGFCHNCLMNEPVKIFGSGSSKIGMYYHFDSDTPIEIHSCTFCFDYKDENVDESMADQFTRMFSSKDRDPAMIETAIQFGKLMKEFNLIDSLQLFKEEISFEELSSEQSHEGEEEVIAALLKVENELKNSSAELRPRLFFYGNNESKYEDIHSYHGMPGFVIQLNDIFSFWLVPSANKKIYDLKSFSFNQESIDDLDEITITDYYL